MSVEAPPPSGPTRPRWRRPLLVFAGCLLAALAIALGLRLALSSAGIRGWLVEQVATRLEDATGLGLALDDWSVGFRSGEITIENLRLENEEGEELFRARRVEADVAWRSLLRRPIRLERLRVESPLLDLRASFPEREETAPRDPSPLRLPVRIDELSVVDGAVELPDLGERAQGFLDRGSIDELALEGQVRPDSLDLRLVESRATLVGERLGPPIEARTVARLAGPLETLRLTDLEVRGPGLRISGSGPLHLRPEGERAIDLELAADAGQLFPELSSGGSIEAKADLDLSRGRAELTIDADRFPGALLEPFLGADVYQRWVGEATTTLEAEGSIVFDRDAASPLHADVDGRLLRDQRLLVELAVETTGGGRDESGAVDLRLLRGRARAVSDRLPLELLRPFLSDSLYRDLGLAGSELDLVVEAATPAAQEQETGGALLLGDRLETRLEARWRRGSILLADAAAEAIVERLSADAPASFRIARGRLDLEAPDLDGALLRGLLPAELADRLDPEGTRVAVDLGFELGDSSSGRGAARPGLHGAGTVAWSREDLRLLDLEVRGQPGSDGALGLDARAALFPELLPGVPSSLTLDADLRWTERLPIPSRLLDGEISEAELDLQIDDLARYADRLAIAMPSLLTGFEDSPWLDRPLHVVATTTAQGPLLEPSFELEARSHLASEGGGAPSRVALDLTGDLGPLSFALDLRAQDVDLALADPSFEGRIAGRAQASTAGLRGVPRDQPPPFQAEVALESASIVFGELEPITDLRVALDTNGEALRLDSLSFRARESLVAASGNAEIASLLSSFLRGERLELPAIDVGIAIEDPWRGVERIAATVSQRAGILELETTELASDAGTGRVLFRAPVSRLTAVAPIAEALDRFRVPGGEDPAAADPIRVVFELPIVDTTTLLPLLQDTDEDEGEREAAPAPAAQRLVARDVRGLFELVLDDWRAARGAIDLAAIEVDFEEDSFRSQGPVEIRVEDGELTLRPFRMSSSERGLYLEASARSRLASDWRFGDDFGELLSLVEAQAEGVVPAGQLNPFLAGGVADGPLAIDLELSAEGSLDRYRGRLEARGEEVVVFYAEPYETRIQAPELEVTIAPDGIVLERGTGTLNRGSFEISGPLTGDDGLRLEADFEELRYRLDYGLVALLSGNLALTVPPEGRSRLDGVLVLERGIVRQRIDLERELRGLLLGVPDFTGTEQTASENIDLDIALVTYNGVRVNNNLAELTAAWTPLDIRGTLAEPLVEGKIDVDPGGLFFAYGQVIRLDSASIELSGLAGVPPKIEATTTSSLEDPSLLRRGTQDAFAAPPATGDAEARTVFAAGLADYYGGMLAESLSDSLGSLKVDIEPLLLFTESDPDARFTVSQDINEYIALGVSINLRSAERRTYLLDFHGFDIAPGLSAQVFTNEERNEGITLQHGVELGKSESEVGIERRIETIRLPDVPHVSRRRLRSNLDYQEGDDLPEGGLFDLEIAAGDYLRRQGYPEARVSFEAEEIGRARDPEGGDSARARKKPEVVITGEADPGPYVTVQFTGERLHPRARSEIRGLYRADFYEPAAIEAMVEEAERALRAEGFLDPEVTITTAPDPENPEAERRVTVHAEGGRKIEIDPPVFTGLPEQDAAYLAARFQSPTARIELAAGLESADRRLLASLRNLGFPEAEIVDRRLSENDKRLEIAIAPGPPRLVSELRIEGLEASREAQWRPELELRAGDRLRNDRIARAAYTLEQKLRRLGHAEADVRPVIGEKGEGDGDDPPPHGTVVTLEVEPGPVFRVSALEFEGERATRPRWAQRLVGVDPGELLDESELAEGRRRLLRTGSFESVGFETRRSPDGDADVVFTLQEKPRYRLSYGLRWESEDGGALVVDARDRNLFGRGITVGARVLQAQDEELLRLFGSVPRLFGSRFTVELLADVREVVEDGLVDRQNQSSLQLARPLTEHLTGRIYGRYRRSRIREVEPDPFFPFDETIKSPILGFQLVFDDRVRSQLGLDGLFATLDVSGADQSLGSDFQYLRIFGQANYTKPVFRIGNRTFAWGQSVRVGFAETFDDQELIRDVRFFAGGEYSVRGYDTESLGPLEDLGFVTRPRGGESLLVINEELRFHLFSRFSGLLFVDAGSVTDEFRRLGSDLFTSAGVGLRAETPIGLIRLDLAFPLDRREGDDSRRIYLGLGHVF